MRSIEHQSDVGSLSPAALHREIDRVRAALRRSIARAPPELEERARAIKSETLGGFA